MNYFLRKTTSYLPTFWQQELKRFRFRRQIRHGTFKTEEPEFHMLNQLIFSGDWVIDVGANVGHYTKRCSDLVGPRGRVIAIEPVLDTFGILTANASLFKWSNVTLLNMAASSQTTIAGMVIPNYDDGAAKNYYQATIVHEQWNFQVMTIALDTLGIKHPISLIKIDAEGHDPVVVEGALQLLTRDHPVLIIETSSQHVIEQLAGLGYKSETLEGSPNMLFRWSK